MVKSHIVFNALHGLMSHHGLTDGISIAKGWQRRRWTINKTPITRCCHLQIWQYMFNLWPSFELFL